MEAYFITDVGKVRSHNEDSGGIFYNQANQVLAIVADGMGGHSAGEVASELATNFIQQKWEKEVQFQQATELEAWILETVKEANDVVYTEAKEQVEFEGMGTTVVLAACTDEFITIAHIGDSRGYLYNDGKLKQLTEDHSLVNELLRAGQISPDDAAYHPRKNVLVRALGTEAMTECEIQTIGWEVEDKLLLCSDGLTNKLMDAEIEDILSKQAVLQEIGEEMIGLANERGGEDNISIALIHHEQAVRAGETE